MVSVWVIKSSVDAVSTATEALCGHFVSRLTIGGVEVRDSGYCW